MLIVGELINSTRKQVRPLLEARDGAAIVDLARRQVGAGAHLVDVNCATLMEDEVGCLAWAIQTIQDACGVRISVDSPNPEALRRGLEVHRGKAMLDSINLEHERWTRFLPVVREFQPEVVALCMDDHGIPATAEGKLALATRLVEGLTGAGVPPQDIYVDPLLFPVATDSNCAKVFLEALYLIRERFPEIHTICGLSNVSFGLSRRTQINQVFLVLCLAHGMDAFILGPLDRRLMANLTTAQMLLGQDEFCQRYLSVVRGGRFDFLYNVRQRHTARLEVTARSQLIAHEVDIGRSNCGTRRASDERDSSPDHRNMPGNPLTAACIRGTSGADGAGGRAGQGDAARLHPQRRKRERVLRQVH